MAPEHRIRRFRRWYGRLLRLYPQTFRERFAEPMAQTFTDLCRERTDANRGLIGLAATTFAETSAGIIRENLAQMTTQPLNYLRWILVTAGVLAIPALAMAFDIAFADPGSRQDGVSWGPMDFGIVGVLVLGFGLLYEYATTRSANVLHRAAVGIAALAALGLIWVNLAVGFMDVENGNLMYVLVLFVALVGLAIGRFEPREASIAMFATAAAQAVVAVIGLVAGLGPTLPADAFWIAAWVASGLLFRRAGLAPSPAR
jgi:hypothetical protein